MSDDLIAAAAAAGAIDASDFAKLVDPAVIKFDADGKPSNLAEVVAGMKAAKPYLFRGAAAMSSAEYATARRDLLRSAGEAQRAEDDRRASGPRNLKN